MDACTHEVRLNQWKLIIEQCQSRPDGQTARPWMAENGVQEKTYYYRLRRVRKEVYSQLSDGSTVAVSNEVSDRLLTRLLQEVSNA